MPLRDVAMQRSADLLLPCLAPMSFGGQLAHDAYAPHGEISRNNNVFPLPGPMHVVLADHFTLPLPCFAKFAGNG